VSTLARRFGMAMVFGAITLAAVPARAQNVSIGYQWQNVSVDDAEDFTDCCNAPFGINFDAGFPITPSIDVIGQLDWSRWSDSEVILGSSVDAHADFTVYGGGIRWSGRGNPSATPFVHGLLGAVHTGLGCEVAGIDCEDVIGGDTSATNFMFQVGGGVVVPVGGVGVVGQFDYRRFFFEDQGANSIRFVVGIRVGLK
jgi:hypothetical protein